MRLDPAGWPFVAIAAGTTLLAAIWHPVLALAPAVLLLFCLNFFRDPERRTPDDPAILLSPADGRVIRADARAVSIFMNVFNVHVCRAPAAGRVKSVQRIPGRFLVEGAPLPEAPERPDYTGSL